ncbi:MAG TPA: MBL fold metallo-hydrolase [Steroidobacteraceae bacterium]
MNVLLVRDGRRILLLDSGLGPKLHGGLLASLELAGVAPSAVTDVLITHPHLDHVGGLIDADGHLAFPNASIRMTSAAWTCGLRDPLRCVAAPSISAIWRIA